MPSIAETATIKVVGPTRGINRAERVFMILPLVLLTIISLMVSLGASWLVGFISLVSLEESDYKDTSVARRVLATFAITFVVVALLFLFNVIPIWDNPLAHASLIVLGNCLSFLA